MTDPKLTTEVVRDAAGFPRDRLGEPRPIKHEDFNAWLLRERADAAAAAVQQLANGSADIPNDPYERSLWLDARARDCRSEGGY